jgi:hypothetical protein
MSRWRFTLDVEIENSRLRNCGQKELPWLPQNRYPDKWTLEDFRSALTHEIIFDGSLKAEKLEV